MHNLGALISSAMNVAPHVDVWCLHLVKLYISVDLYILSWVTFLPFGIDRMPLPAAVIVLAVLVKRLQVLSLHYTI